MDMDNNNQPNKDATDDWRKQLPPDSRKAMVTMIKGTLQGHFPKFGAEELVEHIAGTLEEEILTAATSRSDYLRLIFLKMRTMETIANSPSLNTGFSGGSQNLSASQRPMQLSSGLQPSQSTLNQQLLAQQNQQSNRFMLQKQQQQRLLTMQQQGAKRQRQQYATQSTQHNNMQASSGLQASFAFQQQLIGQKSIMTSPGLQSGYQPNQFAQQSIMTSSGLQQQPDSLTDMQQGIQTSGGSMFNQQSLLDPKQVVHSQNPPPAASPLSTDAATIENATVTGSEVDVLEEIYEAIKSMSENYLTDLRYMFLKIYQKCQPHDALPQFPESEQVTRLKTFKAMLSRMIGFLRLPKSPVPPPSLEDKLASYEKQILNILNSSFQTKPGPRQQQIPRTGGHQLSLQRRLQQPLQQKIQPLTMHQQGVRMPQQQYEQVSANMLQLQQQQIQQQHQLQQQILQQHQLQQQTQLQQQLQQQTQLQQQLQQQIQQLQQLQQQIQQQHQLQNQLPYCCTPTLHTSPVTAATTTVAAAVAGAATTTTVTSEQLHQPQQQIQHSNLYQSFERH